MTPSSRFAGWHRFKRELGHLRRQHRLAGGVMYFFFSYGVFQLAFELTFRLGLIDTPANLVWLLLLAGIFTISFLPARKRLGNGQQP